jgi:hypothetical protein
MGEAIAWKEENDGDTTRIRSVAFKYQALRDAAIEQVTRPDGTPYTVKSWAAAYWRASHTVKENSKSSGSLVFNLFPDEIMTELKENPDPPSFFEVYNVHKQQPNHWSKAKWRGRTVQIRVVLRDWAAPRTGKIVPTLAVDLMYPESTQLVGFYPLGFVAEVDRPKIAIGETRTMKIWTKGDGEIGIPTTKVWLFDESMSEEQIQDVLMFGRSASSLWEPEDFGLSP